MNTNIKAAVTFVVYLTILFLCTGCPWKECTSPDRAYGAEHTFLHKNKIKVGDTIWIESMMDCNKMLNLITNTEDIFCGQDFSFTLNVTNIKMDNIDSTWTGTGAVSDFDFVNKRGRVYNDSSIPAPQTVNQVQFGYEDNYYRLNFGMVCKKSGWFYIRLGSGGSFGKDHCDRSSLDNIITNEERGQDLYVSFRSPHEVTEWDLRNLFCFEVH